jgi:hypothetical protein
MQSACHFAKTHEILRVPASFTIVVRFPIDKSDSCGLSKRKKRIDEKWGARFTLLLGSSCLCYFAISHEILSLLASFTIVLRFPIDKSDISGLSKRKKRIDEKWCASLIIKWRNEIFKPVGPGFKTRNVIRVWAESRTSWGLVGLENQRRSWLRSGDQASHPTQEISQKKCTYFI